MFNIYSFLINLGNLLYRFFFIYIIESVLGTAAPIPDKKKSIGKKKINKDFNVEYAKSGRAVCCGCQDKIVKVILFNINGINSYFSQALCQN